MTMRWTNVEESASNKPPQPAENAPASPVRAGAFSQPGGCEMRSSLEPFCAPSAWFRRGRRETTAI
jgi:hypothetical protein